MQYMETYQLWCKKVQDVTLKNELNSIQDDEKTIENKFFKDLQFGTGGLRGEIGVGSNCLNIYTIGKATQGLADYLKSIHGTTVAVSYDSRINSELFAKHTASVLATNGLTVHLVKELMPTPFLSFATRYYHADAGIMITASHNPAKYNGYKVYGPDGCQITDTVAHEIISCIDRVDCFAVQAQDFDICKNNGKILYIEDCVEEEYLNAVLKNSVYKAEDVRLTYSPLNGTGYRIIPKMLTRLGIDYNVVQEQSYPDGNFTTCTYPNPEKPAAMKLGLERAAQSASDLLIATDPDADRVGVAVKDNGGYSLMTGNEIGVLLLDFILSQRTKNGTLPEHAVVIKTIVTSKLAEKIAENYGVKLINVLTGFKYIGEQITNLEKQSREDDFVLGFEESCGYLVGSYVRDKDSVIATLLVLEMASYYKKQGLTLKQKMNQLYDKYGTYSHKLLSFEFSGADGAKTMRTILENIRNNPPASFAGKSVLKSTDYLTQTEFNLPKSNVLQYDLQDNAQVIVRPSGTEPLIKIYLTAAETPSANATFISAVESEFQTLFKQ